MSACAHLGRPPAEQQLQSQTASEAQLQPLSDTAQKRAEALARYSQGTILEGQKDYEGALSNYLMAAQLDPDNEPLQLRIAVLLIQQNKTTDAVKVLETLSAKPRASDRPLMLLGMIYEGAGDFTNAERVYGKLADLYPDRQEAYANLARVFLKQEKIPLAIQTLEQAADKLNQPDELLMLLAAAYIMRAQKEPDVPEHYFGAIRALERVKAKNAESWRVQEQIQFEITDLYLRAGDYEKALAGMENIEQMAGDPTRIKSQLAGLLLKGRKPDTVLEKLGELAAHETHPERIYYYMGLVSEAAQQTDKASEYYRLAAEGGQPHLGAIVSLAVLQATNLETSTKTVQRGLETFPEHPTLLNVMANICFLQTNYQTAVEYFQRAARQSESNAMPIRNANFFFNYAIALLNLGDTGGAAEQLYEATQLDTAMLENYLQLAFQQTDATLQKRYVEVLENLGERLPGESDVYLYLGVLNSSLGFYPEALRAFERVENIANDTAQKEPRLTAQFYFWYGNAAERSGDIERAEKMFLKCIDLDPNHADALNYLAYMWAERGKELGQAMTYVKRALELQPSSGAYIDTLGWIYFMQGNYTQALVEINRAAELIPEDPTILEHLGDVFEKLGDTEQALPHWKRAFVLNPQSDKLAEKLTRLGVDLEQLRTESEQLKQRQRKLPTDESEPGNTSQPSLLPPTPVEPTVLPGLDIPEDGDLMLDSAPLEGSENPPAEGD